MPSTDWEQRASCRDYVEVFDQTFDSTTRTSARHHGLAAEVCQTCPVRRDCLREALAVETAATRFGMRAGLMPAQRSHLARQSA
jgi:hypothetical protein